MVIASGMKELTQDIASSHGNRMERVGNIKEEAKQVRTEAQDLIEGFQTSRQQAGVELRKDLAKETTHRKSEVKTTLEDAQSTIKGFRSQRKNTRAKLRKELAQSGASNRSEVRQLRKDAQNLIKDFKGSREKAGDELRKDLAEGRADRESEVNKMRNDFRHDQSEVREELEEAASAWQALTKTTQVKRTGVKVRAKVKPPVAEEKVEVFVTEEEIPDLEAKLLAAINEHSSGITLTEVAENLGVVPIVLGRASRSLLEKGKILKEDKLYFPVASK